VRSLAAAALLAVLAAAALAGVATRAALPEGWPERTRCELPFVARDQADPTSCAGCHSNGGRELPRYFEMSPRGFGHPVGIDYAAVQRRTPADFLPPEQLPAAVPLVGGRVACTSCHDASSALPHHTVLGAERDLCLACHRM
jgi:predicted CXXCH cytochrome family protein